MPERYKKLWMWALYYALFILLLLVQSVLLGKVRILGTKLSLLPIIPALVAMFRGKEQGGIFGLVCGLLMSFAGFDGGALNIVIFTAIGLGSGFVCEQFFTKHLLSGMLVCAASLLLSQSLLLAWKQFLALVGFAAAPAMLLQVLLSLPFALLFYPIVRAISKLYHPKTI